MLLYCNCQSTCVVLYCILCTDVCSRSVENVYLGEGRGKGEREREGGEKREDQQNMEVYGYVLLYIIIHILMICSLLLPPLTFFHSLVSTVFSPPLLSSPLFSFSFLFSPSKGHNQSSTNTRGRRKEGR